MSERETARKTVRVSERKRGKERERERGRGRERERERARAREGESQGGRGGGGWESIYDVYEHDNPTVFSVANTGENVSNTPSRDNEVLSSRSAREEVQQHHLVSYMQPLQP